MPLTTEAEPAPVPTRVFPISGDPAATNVLGFWPAAPKSLFPALGDSLLHFKLVGELGSGAFSRVFLATQQDLAGRLVALKVSECSDNEPQRLARLQHANIVPIYSVHHHFQYQVVCMPFVGAHTLAAVLKHHQAQFPDSGRELVDTLRSGSLPKAKTRRNKDARGPLAPAPATPLSPNLELLNRLNKVDAVLWIGARLADGLAHAHERGILHCDLKPQNVLLADDGQPMLLDFNVALDTRSAATPGHNDYFGGTVPYMSPEHLDAVATGGRAIDARSDLYSLGVILYQLLTGRDPHDLPAVQSPESAPRVRETRLRPPTPPSHRNPAITPAVDAIVLKLLAPDPARRYARAADLSEDLERHLANRPLAHAPNTSLSERGRKWRRRNPRLAAALAVGAAALCLLVMPATVMAVRQDQIARRQLELQRAEAQLQRRTALDQIRSAQVLLSSQAGNRNLLDQGLALARTALEGYRLDEEGWANHSSFAMLEDDQQLELRREFGEALLLMARAELLKSAGADPEAARAALNWNRLAEACYPAAERPRWLARQRAELLALAPGAAEPLPDAGNDDLDPYHDGLEEAFRGRHGRALEKLMPFTERHPGHFMAWFARGVSHDGVGQMSEAAAAFTVCAALRPDLPWPHFNRGLVRLRQRRFQAAEDDFSEALRLKSDWTAAMVNRAIAREGRKDWAGADSDLTAALACRDAPSRVLFLRSRVRSAAGDNVGAERDAAEAFKLTPTDAVSWVTRGVWQLAHDPKRALADFDEALRLDPRYCDALQNKAVVLADYLRRPCEAVKVMDKLLELYPDHLEARAGRGVYLARAGNDKRARQDAADCLRDEPTAYRYYQMAGLYAQLASHEGDGQARREALHHLALALRSGFSDLGLMEKDSDLDPIRKTDEFRALATHARALQRPQ